MWSKAGIFGSLVSLLFCLLWTTGCSNGESVAEWEPLTLVPEMRIDGHTAVLSPISNMAVSPDGILAIAERPGASIRFFDPSGEMLDARFREGEGPGEFLAVTKLGWVADTLWVHDFRLNRITLISPQLLPVRNFPNLNSARPADPGLSELPEFNRVRPEALRADGSTLSRLSTPSGDGSENFPEGVTTMGLVSEDGTIHHIVAGIPEGRSRFLWSQGSTRVSMTARAPRKLYPPEFSGRFDSHRAGRMTLELIPGAQSAVTREDGVPLQGSNAAPGDDECRPDPPGHQSQDLRVPLSYAARR